MCSSSRLFIIFMTKKILMEPHGPKRRKKWWILNYFTIYILSSMAPRMQWHVVNTSVRVRNLIPVVIIIIFFYSFAKKNSTIISGPLTDKLNGNSIFFFSHSQDTSVCRFSNCLPYLFI